MPNQCDDCKANPVDIARKTEGTPTAKLIAILEAYGITSAAEMAEIVGISDRAVRKVRNYRTGPTVPGGTTGPELQDRPGTTVPKTELQDRPSAPPLACAGNTTGANNEYPTDIVISKKLASLPEDDVSELMITDIIAWMHGGDRRSAENWLASTTKTFGNDATREGYHKLKTDMATGSVVSRKLQAWSEIARRFKAKPAATANVVHFRPTDTSGRPLPTMSEVLAKIAAEDAAHAAG